MVLIFACDLFQQTILYAYRVKPVHKRVQSIMVSVILYNLHVISDTRLVNIAVCGQISMSGDICFALNMQTLENGSVSLQVGSGGQCKST